MDINIIFKIAAIGIIITVICQVLKKSDRDDIATLVSLVGLIIVLTFVINKANIVKDIPITHFISPDINSAKEFIFMFGLILLTTFNIVRQITNGNNIFKKTFKIIVDNKIVWGV